MGFDGFISYSHAADGRLAPAVQRGLHRLAKPWHRRRALWIFRDQTGLAVTPALWTSIQQALDGSQYFVLMASPEAAGSPWVNREIEHWLATKSADRILPVLTDGEWHWDSQLGDFTDDSTAVPPALRGAFAEEPLYLDLRWARDDLQLSLQHVRFRDAIAQLAAPMHGVSKDELEGEDVRQHRRARRLSVGATALLVLLSLLASMTGVVAVRNADRAEASAVEAREQQQVAAQQRGTAEAATLESVRQQDNARVQEGRAQAAVVETRRQERLAREQRTLAQGAAAEAKREQANAKRFRADAERQQADAQRQKVNAEKQQRLAEDAARDAKQQKGIAQEQQALADQAAREAQRQKANAEQQAAEAQRQQQLANQAELRAKNQEKLAAHHQELARQAEVERRKQEKLAREAAEEARKQKEASARQQRIEINQRLMDRARAMIDADPKKALMLGVAAAELHSDAETRDQLSHLAMATHYAGTITDVTAVVAVAGEVMATASADGTVALWNVTNPTKPVRLATLPAAGTADKTLAASPDGRTLAVVDGSSEAVLWDVADPAHPARTAVLSDAAGIVVVTISPDGTVATSNGDKNTVLWDVTGTAPAKLAVLAEASVLKFGPDGRTGTSISGGLAVVWNLTDPAHPVKGVTLTAFGGRLIPAKAVEFNPKLPFVAVADELSVLVIDLTDPAAPDPGLSKNLGAAAVATFSSMAWSPDGRTLAVGDDTGTTTLRSLEIYGFSWLSTVTATSRNRGGPVRSLAFSSDGRTVTATNDIHAATLFYARGRFPRDATATLPGPIPPRIVGLRFLPGGRSLIAAGRDGTAVTWDLSEPAHPVRGDVVPLHSGTIERTTFSPDGRMLATAGTDKVVRLLDMARPAEPALLASFEGGEAVRAVTFSADGRTLAIGRLDSRTTLWDLADPRQPVRLAELTLSQPVTNIAFSPDGRVMAVGQRSALSLWDLSDRSAPRRRASISLADYIVYATAALAFSPNGQTLAVGTDISGAILMLDVADPAQPRQVGTLIGPDAQVLSLFFSADGRTLVSASQDNAVMLWDVADVDAGLRYATFKSVDLNSDHAALSPDARLVAAGGLTGSPSRNINIFDTTVPKELADDPARQACAVSGRGLNADEWSSYIPELPHRPTC